MQRDEGGLLRSWILYHSAVVGAHNLCILDNGSEDTETLEILEHARNLGVHVQYQYNERSHFARKGAITLSYVRRMTGDNRWCLLIDVDEFLFTWSKTQPVFRSSDVAHALERTLGEAPSAQRALITRGLENVPGRLAVQNCVFSRNIIRTSYSGNVDQGAHLWMPEHQQDTICSAEQLGILHMHNRELAEMKARARRKMQTRVDCDDVEALRNYKGQGFHLVADLLLPDEAAYMARFGAEQDWGMPQKWVETGLQWPLLCTDSDEVQV